MYCRLENFSFWSIRCSSLGANKLLVFILYFLRRLFYRAGDKWWNVGTRENKVHTSTWTSIATTDFGHHEFWSKLLSILLNKENWLDSWLYLIRVEWWSCILRQYLDFYFNFVTSQSMQTKTFPSKHIIWRTKQRSLQRETLIHTRVWHFSFPKRYFYWGFVSDN